MQTENPDLLEDGSKPPTGCPGAEDLGRTFATAGTCGCLGRQEGPGLGSPFALLQRVPSESSPTRSTIKEDNRYLASLTMPSPFLALLAGDHKTTLVRSCLCLSAPLLPSSQPEGQTWALQVIWTHPGGLPRCRRLPSPHSGYHKDLWDEPLLATPGGGEKTLTRTLQMLLAGWGHPDSHPRKSASRLSLQPRINRMQLLCISLGPWARDGQIHHK